MTMESIAHSTGTAAMPNGGAVARPDGVTRPLTESPVGASVEIGLSAAILTVRDDEPQVLVVRGGTDKRQPKDVRTPNPALPSGPFAPRDHRTLASGLRDWVREQTGLGLNYVEQLYTFADRGRHTMPEHAGAQVVSIGYLALFRPDEGEHEADGAKWRSWYDFFPWEDWRDGKPQVLSGTIEPMLQEWAGSESRDTKSSWSVAERKDRLHIAFGMDGGSWDEEKVLERFELLYEAGLIEEADRDGREASHQWADRPALGQALCFDHRRILATAIGRIRAKIKIGRAHV